jgi:Uma2 family endonuclease
MNAFLPLYPDFVVELRPESDRIENLQAKMEKYVANGAQLGWLIDPLAQIVYVYRPGEPMQRLNRPDEIIGGPILPGFAMDLDRI